MKKIYLPRRYNESGLALVSALLLGLLGMLMVATLFLLVDAGAWMSGSKKRYQLALDAAHGGMSFYAQEVINRGLSGATWATMGNYNGLLSPVINDANLQTKLTTAGYIGDGAYPTGAVDANVQFTLPTGPTILVNNQIQATVRGNTGTATNTLEVGGVNNNNSGTITPQHFPYFYRLSTRSGASVNRLEEARLSALYTY